MRFISFYKLLVFGKLFCENLLFLEAFWENLNWTFSNLKKRKYTKNGIKGSLISTEKKTLEPKLYKKESYNHWTLIWRSHTY